MKLPKLELYTKIFIGLVLGLIFGILANQFGFSAFVNDYIKPVGSIFIRLISMIVVPLVFASLLVGTASLNDIRKLGRIGTKTIAYFLCTTAVAITIGLFLVNTLKPGKGLSEQTRTRLEQTGRSEADKRIEAIKKPKISDTLLQIIPTNPVKAFTEGKILQIIFLAIILGIALTLVPNQRAQPLINFFNALNDAMIQVVHLIMKLAPYGVFALIAAVVGDFGLDILPLLLKYALVVIAGLILHASLIYSLAIKSFSRLKITAFYRAIRPAQLIAFSSGSSMAALPVSMDCAEKNLGVSKQVSSFVMPLGATINMNGTAIYQAVSAVFIAQVYNMNLGLTGQLTILLTATLSSIGTAGAPGVGMIMLAMVLESIGVPLEGIALILGVERLLDMCRTTVNITGDLSCAVVVSSTEDELTTVNTEP